MGLSLIGAVLLLRDHPAGSPGWAIWGNLVCQLLAHILTAVMWGPWQAALSGDPAGPNGPFLAQILRTHWVRTALINASVILVVWVARLPS